MARHKMGKKSSKKKVAAKPAKGRRRVGAAGRFEPTLMNGLLVGGGMIAMNELSILAGTMFPSLMANPLMTGIAEFGVGALAAWKGKSSWLMYMGLGAMGNGLYTIGKGTGMIGAAPQTMTYNFQNRRIMGDPRLQFVAGPTTRIGSFPNNFAPVAGINGPGRKRRYIS